MLKMVMGVKKGTCGKGNMNEEVKEVAKRLFCADKGEM
jgi:hypothetical protein